MGMYNRVKIEVGMHGICPVIPPASIMAEFG